MKPAIGSIPVRVGRWSVSGSVLERPIDRLPGADSLDHPVASPFAPAAAGLRRIAQFHAEAPSPAFMTALRATPLHATFALHLDRDDAHQAMALIDEEVSDLPAPITEESLAPLRNEHTAIYHSGLYHTGPTESAWLAEDDGTPPATAALPHPRPDRTGGAAPTDHLVSELLRLAGLLDQGSAACAAAYMDEHLLRWIPAFCSRVATRCREPFYAGVAILTSAHLDHLRDLLAASGNLPRPAEDESADIRRRRWTEGRVPRTCGGEV